MNERAVPVRWLLTFLLVVALLMFFFPLVSIHVPIVGDQEWSGYDVIAKSRDMDRSLDSIRDAGTAKTPSEAPDAPSASSAPTAVSPNREAEELPISMRALPLLPVEIGLAFVGAALGILLNFRQGAARALTFVSFAGGIASALAILHATIANSDLHAWMQRQMNSVTQTGENNRFAGLAKSMADLAINAIQLKPGVGLYVLGVALLASAFLSRLLLAPQPSMAVDETNVSETAEV